MIVKVKFRDDWVMLFGTSYKPWQEQFQEYCLSIGIYSQDVMNAWVSNQEWIHFGGLKWCCEEDFPRLLRSREDRDVKEVVFEEATDRFMFKLLHLLELGEHDKTPRWRE